MKLKPILKFMTISIIIVCLYVSFILNIEHFTMSYNNKKQEYKNVYYRSDNSSDILSKIGYTIDECYGELEESDLDVIRYNKIIRNILKKYSYVEDNEINQYIKIMKKRERIKLIYDNYIYISEDEYQLIFTPDVNNIEYRNVEINMATNGEKSRETNKNIDENKSEIYEKVRTELEELGIIEKFSFEPETLYVQYFYSKQEWQNTNLNEGIYVVEDNKNHIKVEIEVPSYKIKNLKVGFEDYTTVE